MLVLLLMAVTGAWAAAKTIDLSNVTEATTANNGDVLTGTLANNVRISIDEGATVTLNNVTINGSNSSSYYWAGITCKGNATIILTGVNFVKGFHQYYPGIHIPKDKTLTIQGSGSLTACSNGNCAGIGAGESEALACGNIVIEGGTIIATGGDNAAGIGGGDIASCGDISINGGNITATGGENGAGIGSGFWNSCGDISITGGTIIATGGSNAAAIGCGYGGTCGTVTIGGINKGSISASPYTYLALADNEDNSSTLTTTTYNGKKADVTITGRTLYKDGYWNTLCLPFNIKYEDISTSTLAGATIMELDTEGTYGTDNKKTGFDATNSTLYLYFENANSITAGKPYIVRWGTPENHPGGTIENPTFSDVTIDGSDPEPITSKDGNVCFKGNYALVTLTGGDKSTFYLGSRSQLYYPSKDRTINAFRGYFQLTGSQSVRSFVLNFGGNDDTTGIVEVDSGQRTVDSWSDAWFDLQGRKLSGKPTQKGVYIHNGKKRAVR